MDEKAIIKFLKENNYIAYGGFADEVKNWCLAHSEKIIWLVPSNPGTGQLYKVNEFEHHKVYVLNSKYEPVNKTCVLEQFAVDADGMILVRGVYYQWYNWQKVLDKVPELKFYAGMTYMMSDGRDSVISPWQAGRTENGELRHITEGSSLIPVLPNKIFFWKEVVLVENKENPAKAIVKTKVLGVKNIIKPTGISRVTLSVNDIRNALASHSGTDPVFTLKRGDYDGTKGRQLTAINSVRLDVNGNIVITFDD